MWNFASYTLLSSLSILILLGGWGNEISAAEDKQEVKHKPLKVVVRPRRAREEKPLIEPELQRQIENNSLDFQWQDILDHRYLSGYQDEEAFRKYGYSLNSEIGGTLQEKQRGTDDPDNMLHLTEYADRQIYSEASLVNIRPMALIRRGCQPEIGQRCSFSGQGQHWVKSNMTLISISRDRLDNDLPGLLRSLEE